MQWLLVGLTILAGLGNPIQSAANSGLHKAVGDVVLSALLIYAVAILGILVLSPLLGLSLRGLGHRIVAVPWWGWLGGLCNLAFVAAAAVATKRIGSATFTIVTLVCAVVLSIVMDQFGIMGLEHRPATVLRLLGGAFAITGVALVALF